MPSDLKRLDAMRDEDIDTRDAPVPDLADWVRHARLFSPIAEATEAEVQAAVRRVVRAQAGVLNMLKDE